MQVVVAEQAEKLLGKERYLAVVVLVVVVERLALGEGPSGLRRRPQAWNTYPKHAGLHR